MNLHTPVTDKYAEYKDNCLYHGDCRIFLAGPIRGARDWQKEVEGWIKDDNCEVFSPRWEENDKYKLEFNEAKQTGWEHSHLKASDIIYYGLVNPEEGDGGDENHDYAQTTRIELGAYLMNISINGNSRNKYAIVYLDNKIKGSTYIKDFCRRYNTNLRIFLFTDYEESINKLRELIRRVNSINMNMEA